MSRCVCKECKEIKTICEETFDSIPRELVWLVHRFARASPFQECIPHEFVSYPFVSLELYHSIPHNSELISQQVLPFLYSKRPTFSMRYSESWRNESHNLDFTITFDTDNIEWIGTIEIPESLLEPFHAWSLNVSCKPTMIFGSVGFSKYVFPFFGVNVGSNCYHAIKRVLKEYEYEINKKFIK